MRRIRLLEEAAQEAIEAAAWYEQERTGLGWDFARAIETALDLLQDDIVPLAP
jgi:toxin ParE1/3/4